MTQPEAQEREAAYAATFQYAPEAMWCYDVETLRFLAVNDAAVDCYGWTEDEFLAMTILDIRPDEDVPVLREALAWLDAGGTPPDHPWRHRTKDGEILDVMVSSRPIMFLGHEARMTVARDITEASRLRQEREDALQALRTSEQRLEVLFQHSTEVVTISDSAGRLRFISASALSPLLATGEPHIGIDLFGFAHPDDEAMNKRMHARAQERPGETLGPVVYRLNPVFGRERWLETTWVDLSHVPAVGGIVSHTRDVTDRALAEHSLRDSEERFRMLIEYSAEAIMVIGAEGRLLYQTSNLDRLVGWTGEEDLNRSSFADIHPDDRIAFDDAVAAARAGHHQPVRIETRVRNGDEWRTLDVILRDLSHLPLVGGLVFNIRDVTDRRRMEQQYLQAQKMEALGRLVGGVAHDFNNILTAVMGHAELLIDGRAPDDPDRSGLQAILDAGSRAVDLTAQLLSVTRHRVIVPEVFDLNEAVRQITPMLVPILGDDIRLVTRFSTGPAWVRADPGRIDQVVLNLVVNAGDALPQGGEVCMAVEIRPGDAGAATPVEGADAVCLTISDSGVGMPDVVQEHMYEPFFTTKADGLGTGLGLATVYGIVDQAGGLIEVDSRLDVGTTFRILLPMADPVSAVSTADAPGGVDRAEGASSVLVVEDEELVRSLAVRSLRRDGFSVIEADSLAAAVAIASDATQTIDIVVTDVVLGDGRASDLVARLDEVRPLVPVLHVSGYALDTMVQSGEIASGVEFLGKPYRPAELVGRVRQMLGLPPIADDQP